MRVRVRVGESVLEKESSIKEMVGEKQEAAEIKSTTVATV